MTRSRRASIAWLRGGSNGWIVRLLALGVRQQRLARDDNEQALATVTADAAMMRAADLTCSGSICSEHAARRRPSGHAPLLRVPPFPGSKRILFGNVGRSNPTRELDANADKLIAAIRSLKVGGTYWGSQPPLPQRGYTLVRVRDSAARVDALAALPVSATILVWTDSRAEMPRARPAALTVAGPCDPWHLLSGASGVIVDSDDELALLAAVAGLPAQYVGSGRFAALADKSRTPPLCEVFRENVLNAAQYVDPFSGEPLSIGDAIQYCGFWRDLIDRNRQLRGAAGFAFWKRSTVSPLLWAGCKVPFISNCTDVQEGDRIAIWKSRAAPRMIAELRQRGAQLVEVEDGFIRSAGLGADCVPPLSIVVDDVGAHFDPNSPSELEQLLENGSFPADMLDRARQLRGLIVESGLTKYAAGQNALERRVPDRCHILVPGQVEDDLAVVCGGAGLTSNLELLRRVRQQSPDAFIIYKPHPDVEAGHRSGSVPEERCLAVADEIVRGEPMSALLELVDEVHVNTSLAGFEALLRGKPVTTHGVPFYAGWGLTRDLGPVPSRRTATRSIDELAAAVLLLYPRYLDPVTGLPCPAEVLVQRLCECMDQRSTGVLVELRRLQGRCRRGIASLRNWL